LHLRLGHGGPRCTNLQCVQIVPPAWKLVSRPRSAWPTAHHTVAHRTTPLRYRPRCRPPHPQAFRGEGGRARVGEE
jgi:hypothetical protein